MNSEEPLWRPAPERVAGLPLTRFAAAAAGRAGRPLPDYAALHAWSIEDRAAFWDLVWDFTGVIGEKGSRRLVDGGKMPGARFFPDAQMNFAENLLRRNDDGEAIVFRGEEGDTRRLSWRKLNDLVSRLQQALVVAGVGVGDHVAAYLPNIPEAVAAMLATASLGAVWSSASPDFGVDGVVDRFGQIAPKVFIAADGYRYAGKEIDLADKVKAIVPRLGVTRTFVVSVIGKADALAAALPEALTLVNALAPFTPPRRSPSHGCRSPTRFTFSFRRARPACQSASSTPPAERSFSTSRSTACTRRSARATGFSTSPRWAG